MKRIFYLLLILILSQISMSKQVNSREDGLIGVWHFNEETGAITKDETGNTTGAVTGAWVTGKYGSALNFTGTQNVDFNATNYPATGQSFSFGFWYYKTTNINSNDTVIIWKGYFALYYNQSASNYWRLAYSNGGDNVIYPHDINTWTHFFLTYNGNLTFKLYKNGNYLKTVTASVTPSIGDAANNAWHYIGNENQGNPFDGSLDDVVIYKQRILPDGEIHNIYLEGKGKFIN